MRLLITLMTMPKNSTIQFQMCTTQHHHNTFILAQYDSLPSQDYKYLAHNVVDDHNAKVLVVFHEYDPIIKSNILNKKPTVPSTICLFVCLCVPKIC